jgi:cytoskeletal protein RodZ
MNQQAVAPRSRPRKKTRMATTPQPNGLDVMGLLVAACAVIVVMLVVSLNWQHNAYALAQQEVDLRSALDQTSDERQQVLTEQRRALNPRETAARSADVGLKAFKLDERTAAAPPKPKAKASPSPASTNHQPKPKNTDAVRR